MQVLISALSASCVKDNPSLMSQLNTVSAEENAQRGYGIWKYIAAVP